MTDKMKMKNALKFIALSLIAVFVVYNVNVGMATLQLPSVTSSVSELMSVDSPAEDYFVYVEAGGGQVKEENWDLTKLIPQYNEASLIVSYLAFTPVAYVSNTSPSVAYAIFMDEHENSITHLVSCGTTLGVTTGYIAYRPILGADIYPKVFKIESNRLWLRAESMNGGFSIRIIHPLYKNYALPYYKAYDTMGNYSIYLWNFLGMTGKIYTTDSYEEIPIFNVNLSQPRNITRIAQRLEISISNSLAESYVKMYWSSDNSSWNEFFSSGNLPDSGVFYPQVDFDPPQSLRYIKMTAKSDGSATITINAQKLFAWGE